MKHYSKGNALNAKIIEGVDILADNVATTLGPRGRNVCSLSQRTKRACDH